MSRSEFEILESMCVQLDELDDGARGRVLRYLFDRYPAERTMTTVRNASPSSTPAHQENIETLELRGIAVATADGGLRMTIRDLKARTAKDAARRLIYVTILANETLSGSRQVSSRKTVVPALREYRLYDGNTRTLMSTDKGIIRSGDLLALDAHARAEAETFLQEMQDPSIIGSWRPGAQSRGNKRTS